MAQPGLAGLPDEIVLKILAFLEPAEVVRLQLLSKHFRSLCRDNVHWRSLCFEESSYLDAVIQQQRRANSLSPGDQQTDEHDPIRKQKARLLANWDPTYPQERVSWYDEYIHRHAPIVVNWLEQPYMKDGSVRGLMEARGAAVYRPDEAGSLLAVSPLDDGSVCLWDVSGSRGRRGAIVAKSPPGILFVDGAGADNSSRSKRIDSGVTECVSVDSQRHRGYFAVQSHLIEVDLQRLSVVGLESFPWSITALSEAHPSVPLTVGTSLGIHMHDSRAPAQFAAPTANGSSTTAVDTSAVVGAKDFYARSFQDLFADDELPPYASLAQSGSLSILHLQKPGAEVDLSDDIYVAGRFSNILHYDRRKFPSIMGSIHSGARLSSLTSLPWPFSSLDAELRRKGRLSMDQIAVSKTAQGGRTLVACGEYGTKGSLEMYGLCDPSLASPNQAGGLQTSTLKNRQTSSPSKLLSVVNHGTCLAVSDGSGSIKWFERDGFTEVRRCRIGHCERDAGPSLFASMPGSDDLARKLLPTQLPGRGGGDEEGVNKNDLLFWTGEKLGLIGFSSQPGFTADDFEDNTRTAEEAAREREEHSYGEMVRQALQRQADEARFVRNLGGLGSDGLRG